ncbi:MAG: hypothetical protein AB7H80_11410, partial [Candidatus Kapaibacterium sp.]
MEWSNRVSLNKSSETHHFATLRYVLSDRVVNGRQNPLCHAEASRRWSGAIGYLSTSPVRLITSLRYVLSDRV